MKYLYYTLYRLMSQSKTNNTPDINAMILLSLIEFSNLACIVYFIPSNLKINLSSKNEVIVFAIFESIALFTVNYFVLVKNAPLLLEKYKDETKEEKSKGIILLLSYAVISIAVMIALYSL